jgi:hypothetical protein
MKKHVELGSSVSIDAGVGTGRISGAFLKRSFALWIRG